jgi:hypothetical protein
MARSGEGVRARLTTGIVVLCSGAAVAGCDVSVSSKEPDAPPALHALATYPANGAGTACGPDAADDCGVPYDAPIEIRFDRFLLPKSSTRQALRVYSGTPAQALFLVPEYDVVERVVTFRPAYGASFAPGLVYRVELVTPGENENGYGFRAFDGAPLVQEGSTPLRFSFRTSQVKANEATPPVAPTCKDAIDAFARNGCTSCHAAGSAAMGLALDSGPGLRQTAVSHVSHEVEGPEVNDVLVDAPRFGLGLALLEPGSPSRSYLVYKLLVNPANFTPSGDAGDACTSTHHVLPSSDPCGRPTDDEVSRLANWFVRADPMPPVGALPGGLQDLRFLTEFIRGGADTDSCD